MLGLIADHSGALGGSLREVPRATKEIFLIDLWLKRTSLCLPRFQLLSQHLELDLRLPPSIDQKVFVLVPCRLPGLCRFILSLSSSLGLAQIHGCGKRPSTPLAIPMLLWLLLIEIPELLISYLLRYFIDFGFKILTVLIIVLFNGLAVGLFIDLCFFSFLTQFIQNQSLENLREPSGVRLVVEIIVPILKGFFEIPDLSDVFLGGVRSCCEKAALPWSWHLSLVWSFGILILVLVENILVIGHRVNENVFYSYKEDDHIPQADHQLRFHLVWNDFPCVIQHRWFLFIHNCIHRRWCTFAVLHVYHQFHKLVEVQVLLHRLQRGFLREQERAWLRMFVAWCQLAVHGVFFDYNVAIHVQFFVISSLLDHFFKCCFGF